MKFIDSDQAMYDTFILRFGGLAENHLKLSFYKQGEADSHRPLLKKK